MTEEANQQPTETDSSFEVTLETYTIPLLRNFNVGYLRELLSNEFSDFKDLFKGSGSGYFKIQDILNQKIRDGYNDEKIEKTLFNNLVYQLPDHIYLYPLISDIDAAEFMERYADQDEMNRKLTHLLPKEESLVTIRRDENKVILIFRHGKTIKGPDLSTAVYSSCILDFDDMFFSIKLRKTPVKFSNNTIKGITQLVLNYINEKLDFEINVPVNDTSLHRSLYYLFKDESSIAEKVIKSHMDEMTETELNTKVNTFLEDLKINQPEEYIEKVKSTYYQDLASQLNDNIFKHGYIFALVFLDRQFTKSTTRSGTRDAIYNQKIYWNLKDLIHSQQELTDISMYWRFDKEDFEVLPEGNDFSFVEVSLREKYGSLEIHLYQSSESSRRDKLDYVMYKIKNYLWPERLS